MRVLIVSTLYAAPWAGSEELWYGFAHRALQEGHKVTVCVDHQAKSTKQITELVSKGGQVVFRSSRQPVHLRLARRVLPSSLIAKLENDPVTISVLTLLRSQAFDLILISEAAMWPPQTLLEVAAASKTKYFLLTQGNSEEYWPSEKIAKSYIECLNSAQCVFFVSHENKSLAESQIGYRFRRAEIVWNPLRFECPEGSGFTLADEPLQMGCIARLYAPQKGQDKLLRVLATERWRAREWSLSFGGVGPNEMALRRFVQLENYGHRVEFCGHVADIENFWRGKHIQVLPSRYEGMPLSIIEAAACGRATLTTDVSDNSLWIHNGVNGYICPGLSVSSLSETMERMWKEKSKLSDVGQAARQTIGLVAKENSVDRFYHSILGSSF